jgi:hypothetical protein
VGLACGLLDANQGLRGGASLRRIWVLADEEAEDLLRQWFAMESNI